MKLKLKLKKLSHSAMFYIPKALIENKLLDIGKMYHIEIEEVKYD